MEKAVPYQPIVKFFILRISWEKEKKIDYLVVACKSNIHFPASCKSYLVFSSVPLEWD
jgi:hypothetical protein